MDNSNNTSIGQRLILSESTSEWFFIVLVCMLWASSLFGTYVFVAVDKVLGTGVIFRTIGKTIIYIIVAIGSLSYCGNKIRPLDWLFVAVFLLLFFLAPNASFVPTADYEGYTLKFLWALPLFLVGIALDFSKAKNIIRLFSIISIAVESFYYLVFIHGADYLGRAEFAGDNMTASYSILLNTLFMIWMLFSSFSRKSMASWVDLASVVLGVFSMLMLGTRGPVICVLLFVMLFLLVFKLQHHILLYSLLFVVIGWLFISQIEAILLSIGQLALDLGFSTRITELFLVDAFQDESSIERMDFYPVLIAALKESPIWGYGLFGSYKFIQTYPHNIFTEILFSFGYGFGGLTIVYVAYSTIKAFRNNLTDDEQGFLFVLIGAGVIGLLFSSMFFITPAFYLFLGYCIQLAYRKNDCLG